jgi:hypothetical protein
MGGLYPCKQSPHWTKDPVTGFWSGEKPIFNTKANGATAGKVPVGDGYDVDFVAHEFSHQFGTSHTWSGKGSSCSPPNFMAASAMEIGAGSTLVTYAGICDDDNTQMRSDPYFHVYNLNEFQENYFQSADTAMQTCGTSTVLTNQRPTANVPATCAIPKNTPFFLQGSGTDPNAADVLAYTWEQVDPAEFAESMSIGFKKGPLFRSVPPSANGFLRNFPNMTAAIVPKGWETPWPGERLPFTARDIHFAMTVRDNYMAAKPTLASQDLAYGSWHAAITKVNVVDLGPMLVEQPAAGASVAAGITLVTFKLDGYKNPAASTAAALSVLNDVKGAKFTFEVTTNGGLTWTNLVRSQHLVKLNDKGEGSAYVVLPASLVGSTVAQIRVVADMAKVPGQTTTGCAFWAPTGKFTVTAARPVPTVTTTQPAAAANGVPATISAISFGFAAPVFFPNASIATVAAASGTPTTITLSLFEDGASTANFAFPTSLTFTAGLYTVTVPAGYFHDGLGNNVAGFTSTFTVATVEQARRRALNGFSDALTLIGFTPRDVTSDLTWGTVYTNAAKSIDHAAPAFTTNSTIKATFSRAIRIPDDSDKVISIEWIDGDAWATDPYCSLPLIATDEDGEKITNPDIDVDGAQLLISPNENCPLYAGGQFRLKIPADAIYDMAETKMTTASEYFYFNTIPDTTPPTLQECPQADAKWGATDVDETQPLVLCFIEEACNPSLITPRPHLDWYHAISHRLSSMSPPYLSQEYIEAVDGKNIVFTGNYTSPTGVITTVDTFTVAMTGVRSPSHLPHNLRLPQKLPRVSPHLPHTHSPLPTLHLPSSPPDGTTISRCQIRNRSSCTRTNLVSRSASSQIPTTRTRSPANGSRTPSTRSRSMMAPSSMAQAIRPGSIWPLPPHPPLDAASSRIQTPSRLQV